MQAGGQDFFFETARRICGLANVVGTRVRAGAWRSLPRELSLWTSEDSTRSCRARSNLRDNLYAPVVLFLSFPSVMREEKVVMSPQ